MTFHFKLAEIMTFGIIFQYFQYFVQYLQKLIQTLYFIILIFN